MQVSLVSSEGLKRTLKVELPAERVESKVETRLRSMTKTVRVNGFRPGKVPFSVVKSRFAESVRQEVLGGVIQETFAEAISEQKLNPAGLPSVTLDQSDAKEGYTYSAEFEVMPEIEPADVSALEIETIEASVEDADIDTMLESLRKQRVAYEAVEREAAKDDQVIIDFTGYLNEEAFEGGHATEVPLVLGSGQMIPGFEDAIVGIKAGEERKIDVTFPEEYQVDTLAGQATQFDIKCHEVREPKLPELSEEFVKSLGVESGDADELKRDIRANMERELANAIENQVKERVMDGLLSINEFEVPTATVKEEAGRLKQEFMDQMSQNGQNFGGNLPDEMFMDRATRRVKLGLLVGEMVRKNEIEVKDDDVQAKLTEIASAYDEPQQVIEYYNSNQQLMQNVRGVVLESNVVAWVLENAKTTATQSNFSDVMNAARN